MSRRDRHRSDLQTAVVARPTVERNVAEPAEQEREPYSIASVTRFWVNPLGKTLRASLDGGKHTFPWGPHVKRRLRAEHEPAARAMGCVPWSDLAKPAG